MLFIDESVSGEYGGDDHVEVKEMVKLKKCTKLRIEVTRMWDIQHFFPIALTYNMKASKRKIAILRFFESTGIKNDVQNCWLVLDFKIRYLYNINIASKLNSLSD